MGECGAFDGLSALGSVLLMLEIVVETELSLFEDEDEEEEDDAFSASIGGQ